MEDALKKRLHELALRAVHTGRPAFTRFLEPADLDEARAAAARAGATVCFWGGYEDAERRVAAFCPAEGEAPGDGEWPVRALRLDWNARFSNPGHRDLLGAVMGLGIERETTGDIAMATRDDRPCACLFAHADVADYIAANLDGAGRAALRVTPVDAPPKLLPPEGQSLRLTVQHQRLDAVLAAACRLSRAEAQRLIAGGLVKLNHAPCLRPDARLEAGDLISARGLGRVKVEAFPGETRRGRRVVQVFKYGK